MYFRRQNKTPSISNRNMKNMNNPDETKRNNPEDTFDRKQSI